jgi:hypothetical protein
MADTAFQVGVQGFKKRIIGKKHLFRQVYRRRMYKYLEIFEMGNL